MSVGPEANALQTGFMRLKRSFPLSASSLSSDLAVTVFGNWTPLCPAAFSPTGDVFHALADLDGHAKIIRYNLADPSKLTSIPVSLANSTEPFNVAFGNLDDSNYPMARLLHSQLGIIVLLWLQNSSESPSGTFINVVTFDTDDGTNPTRTFASFPYLSNYQEFQPFMSSANLIFSLGSTSTGVPCVLRIQLVKGALSIVNCQPLTGFLPGSITSFMSLSAIDAAASQLLLSADGYGYIGSWAELSGLLPVASTTTSLIGTRAFTRLRSINTLPQQKQPYAANGTLFSNFIVSVDSSSTVRYFGVPRNANRSDAWKLLWTVTPQMYPVLAGSMSGRSNAYPVGYDDQRQWIYVCAGANNQAQSEGHLLAFATYSGDVVWGGDDTGSIPCFRDSILGVNYEDGLGTGSGSVLATSVTDSSVSLYKLTGNDVTGAAEYTQKVWSVLASAVRAPFAFTPSLWVTSGGNGGILVSDSKLVGFGDAFKSGPVPVPAVIPIRPVSFENVMRPTTSRAFVVKPTSPTTAVSSGSAPTGVSERTAENNWVAPISSVAMTFIVAGAILFFALMVTLVVWRSKRPRKNDRTNSPHHFTAGQDYSAQAVPETVNAPSPIPYTVVVPSSKPSAHPSLPEMNPPFRQNSLLTKQQAPETITSTAPSEQSIMTAKLMRTAGSSASLDKEHVDYVHRQTTTSKRSSPSPTATTKRNNSVFSIFFPDRRDRERRESAFSVDTVIASASGVRPRRTSGSTIVSSTATIKASGHGGGVPYQSNLDAIADVETESDVTTTMVNSSLQNQLLDPSWRGKGAFFFKEDGSKEFDDDAIQGREMVTPMTPTSQGRTETPSSIASASFSHVAQVAPIAAFHVQAIRPTGLPLEPQDVSLSKAHVVRQSEPMQEKLDTKPAAITELNMSHVISERPDSSLQFYGSAVEAAAAAASARISSVSPASFNSYEGYDASLSSNSMDRGSNHTRASVLSTASSESHFGTVGGSIGQQGFVGRFWDSGRGSSVPPVETVSKKQTANPNNALGPRAQSAVSQMTVNGLSSNPALLPLGLSTMSLDDAGTEDELVYESGASFVTAPESLYQRSFRSSRNPSSHLRNGESDTDNDGYVTAASSLSTTSGSRASDGYVTAPEDLPRFSS
ncbi:hypothetical protein HDU77_002407 [Chytriomyces hyalinus]|nr:hypothetical protein HDU77_002407 [Chytriomyces hyalinus]